MLPISTSFSRLLREAHSTSPTFPVYHHILTCSNVLSPCRHCQCDLVVVSSHPFASTNGPPFASHALTLSFPFHLPLVVIWCQTFLLFPASSPFHHPPLQLGGRHLFDYPDKSVPSFFRVSTFHRFNWAAVLSHHFDVPPSLVQFSTTPTAAFCYEYRDGCLLKHPNLHTVQWTQADVEIWVHNPVNFCAGFQPG